ncbi:GNAT family N-acetyltransferase [Clostridium chrysemydis]|uniref:GNAT family N-acetyltransferase n=1 Tax=Clostridium chrysemydis TaxID=2665504 RepID=UPI001883504B|nr:GNAT family N-acetyltransferase [Clostridium chrysemydis]
MDREYIEIDIVIVSEGDIDEVELLYNDLNDAWGKRINYPGWKKGIYPIRSIAEKGVSEGNLYIAKYKGKIVGSIILNHEPESAYKGVKWKITDNYSEILVIHTLVVNPNYFRLKIGEKLMDFAYELAENLNMKSIRLDVYENNKPAIKLYEKCGYVYIDTVDLGLREYGLDWFKLYEKVV